MHSSRSGCVRSAAVGRSLTTSELLRPAAVRSMGEEWGALGKNWGEGQGAVGGCVICGVPEPPKCIHRNTPKTRHNGRVSVDTTTETSRITRCWHLELPRRPQDQGSEAENGQARTTPQSRFLSGNERNGSEHTSTRKPRLSNKPRRHRLRPPGSLPIKVTIMATLEESGVANGRRRWCSLTITRCRL